MKKIILPILLSAITNINAETYTIKLNVESPAISVSDYIKPTPPTPTEPEYLSQHVTTSSTNTNYKYSCSTALNCIDQIAGNMQVKLNYINVYYTLDSEQTFRSFDWFYNVGGVNINKFPRNVEIYYKKNGSWVSTGIVYGLVGGTTEIINYNIDFNVPKSTEFRFRFKGTTNSYPYTWIQMFRVVK